MERKEFMQFANALKTYYPKENILPNKQSMELWYQILKDIIYLDAVLALQRWVSNERWSPTISDIRTMVGQLSDGTVGDWTAGWREVTRAISNYGIYRESEALESMSEVTRSCVESIGWKNICNSEEVGVERGHFRTMFEQRSLRLRKARNIPESLKTPIESTMIGMDRKEIEG